MGAVGCLGQIFDGRPSWLESACLMPRDDRYQNVAQGCYRRDSRVIICWCRSSACNDRITIWDLYSHSALSTTTALPTKTIRCWRSVTQLVSCTATAKCYTEINEMGQLVWLENPCYLGEMDKNEECMNIDGRVLCFCALDQCNTESLVKEMYEKFQDDQDSVNCLPYNTYDDYENAVQCPATVHGCYAKIQNGQFLNVDPCYYSSGIAAMNQCYAGEGNAYDCWCEGSLCNTQSTMLGLLGTSGNYQYGYSDYYQNLPNYAGYDIYGSSISNWCWSANEKQVDCQNTPHSCYSKVSSSGQVTYTNDPCHVEPYQQMVTDVCMPAATGENYDCWCLGSGCNTQEHVLSVYDQFGFGNNQPFNCWAGQMGTTAFACQPSAIGCYSSFDVTGSLAFPPDPCLYQQFSQPCQYSNNAVQECYCLGSECNTVKHMTDTYNKHVNDVKTEPVSYCYRSNGQSYKCEKSAVACLAEIVSDKVQYPAIPCVYADKFYYDGPNTCYKWNTENKHYCWCNSNECNKVELITKIYNQYKDSLDVPKEDYINSYGSYGSYIDPIGYPAVDYHTNYGLVSSCYGQGFVPFSCNVGSIGCLIQIFNNQPLWSMNPCLMPYMIAAPFTPTLPCFQSPYTGLACYCQADNCNTDGYVSPIISQFQLCQDENYAPDWCSEITSIWPTGTVSKEISCYKGSSKNNITEECPATEHICVTYFNINGEMLDDKEACHKGIPPFVPTVSQNCLYSEKSGECGCFCQENLCNTAVKMEGIYNHSQCLLKPINYNPKQNLVISCFHSDSEMADFCPDSKSARACFADRNLISGEIIWHSSGCMDHSEVPPIVSQSATPCYYLKNGIVRCLCQRTNCNSKPQMESYFDHYNGSFVNGGCPNSVEVENGIRCSAYPNYDEKVCPKGTLGCAFDLLPSLSENKRYRLQPSYDPCIKSADLKESNQRSGCLKGTSAQMEMTRSLLPDGNYSERIKHYRHKGVMCWCQGDKCSVETSVVDQFINENYISCASYEPTVDDHVVWCEKIKDACLSLINHPKGKCSKTIFSSYCRKDLFKN